MKLVLTTFLVAMSLVIAITTLGGYTVSAFADGSPVSVAGN